MKAKLLKKVRKKIILSYERTPYGERYFVCEFLDGRYKRHWFYGQSYYNKFPIKESEMKHYDNINATNDGYYLAYTKALRNEAYTIYNDYLEKERNKVSFFRKLKSFWE